MRYLFAPRAQRPEEVEAMVAVFDGAHHSIRLLSTRKTDIFIIPHSTKIYENKIIKNNIRKFIIFNKLKFI